MTLPHTGANSSCQKIECVDELLLYFHAATLRAMGFLVEQFPKI